MTAPAASMVVRPCGERALLVECPDAEHRRRLDDALRRAPLPGMVDRVPAAVTVLVVLDSPARLPAAARALRALDLGQPSADSAEALPPLEVPVRYDGADLEEVAALLGISPREVVARHLEQVWRVEFAGFMPGFGYLVGERGGLEVPRRSTPRTRIPAGAVALAGPHTGIYPQASPGGWQLIGSTELRLWDVDRQPPALLVPGRVVRFVEVGR